MKTKSKKIKQILIWVAGIILIVYTGISVITNSPPIVFLDGKLCFTYKSSLDIQDSRHDESFFTNDDVDALSKFKWVKEINMAVTHITDISFLNNMKLLKDMHYCGEIDYLVTDWSPLSSCKELETFCGMRLNMTDLSAFKELVNLKELYLENDYGSPVVIDIETKISDISDVKYLINLEKLFLEGENITDISALKYCTKLKTIDLYGTNAEDYFVLLELPELKSLSIDKGVLTESEIKALEEKGIEVREQDYSEEK